ncbi:MAG: NAD(P)/FAD-dependent oxidoreductase [Parvibaculum sp.]
MTDRFDLVVAGASFAGLACARAAALRGLNVLVVEKKSSPDAKLHTTGIIVKDAIDDIEWLRSIPAEAIRKVPGVRLFSPNLRSIDLHAPGYYFLTTDTPMLMQWMADECLRAGATINLNTTLRQLDENSGSLIVNKEIETRYLVGADGPNSTVARIAGLGRNTEFLYGIEHEFEGLPLPDPDYLHCFIDRKLARGYIGWAVQGPRATQVGVAARMPHSRSSQAWMTALFDKIRPTVDTGSIAPASIRAGMIPCGGLVTPSARRRIMLVGDAAGMVSPVTAGGIHNAVKHGLGAGNAIADHLHGQADDPAGWYADTYPRYQLKVLARRIFDRFQSDAAFNLLLRSGAMRRLASEIYFHRKASYYRNL